METHIPSPSALSPSTTAVLIPQPHMKTLIEMQYLHFENAKWHIKLCSGSLAPSDKKHSPTNISYKGAHSICQEIIDRKINHLKWGECSTKPSFESQSFWFCAWNILAEDKDFITCWNEKCIFLRTYFWTHGRNARVHFWMKEFSIPSSASKNLRKMEVPCVKGDAVIHWFLNSEYRSYW